MTLEQHDRCWKCGESLKAATKFCGKCGSPTRQHQIHKRRQAASDVGESRKTVAAIATVYGGVFFTLFLTAFAVHSGADEVTAGWLCSVGFVLAGGSAVLVLGRGAARATLGSLGTATDVLWGVLAGLGTVVLSWLYVMFLVSVLGAEGERGVETTVPTAILMTAVLPALVEEWLCRGVLFHATRRATSERMTIVTTALLFGFLHALGGGYVLEIPHRFTAGLVFGWLRARTGSLIPCIVAHFLHNLIAVLYF